MEIKMALQSRGHCIYIPDLRLYRAAVHSRRTPRWHATTRHVTPIKVQVRRHRVQVLTSYMKWMMYNALISYSYSLILILEINNIIITLWMP